MPTVSDDIKSRAHRQTVIGNRPVQSSSPPVPVLDHAIPVAGIDVGGFAKGFHAVVIRNGAIDAVFRSTKPSDMAAWCVDQGAMTVGVDAPCRWSTGRGSRSAERKLSKDGIRAFSTPSYAKGASNPFYRWMVNGAELYQALERRYRLYDGVKVTERLCFETFPQAIACALAGRIVPAADKRNNRREVLRRAGLDSPLLTNIDYIDAALCALACFYIRAGAWKSYGDEKDGYIFVPRVAGGALALRGRES